MIRTLVSSQTAGNLSHFFAGHAPALLIVLLPLLWFSGCTPSAMPPETAPEVIVTDETGQAVITIESGFQPDPFIYELRAGGPVEASDQGLNGYIPQTPSVIMELSPDKYPLTLILRSDSDTVMMIRTPGGRTLFNDDFDNLNAGITLYEPEEGRYEIYAGLLGDSLPVPAELEITEIYAPDRPAPVASPDLDGDPLAGSTRLSASFSPEPFEQAVMLDGTLSFGSEYNGFFTAGPTFRLDYTAGDVPLTLINADDETDTVMLVYSPEGIWQYNDDFDDLNAGIRFDNPASGEYLVWMGTYGEGTSEANLIISESYVPQAERLPDTTLEPEYGAVELAAGFEPDPSSYEVFLYGEMNYANYSGMFGQVPSFALDYEAGGDAPLTLLAPSNNDTVILVYGPDQEWYYNDDFNDLDAGLYFENPASGRYLIWLGAYGEEGIEASLEIHETYIPPSERQPDILAEPMERLEFTPNQATPIERGIALDTYVQLSETGTGYVSEAPQFSVEMADADGPVMISAGSELDTTLLVYTPSGEWLFNDDSEGRNPGLEIETPEPGEYLIWVGSFYSTDTADGTSEGVIFRIE